MAHGKDPDFVVHDRDPLNGGPPTSRLTDAFLTPTGRFFVRNHGPVPDGDPDSWTIVVDGLVAEPLRMAVDELREAFGPTTLTATLQCAGNRRDELARVAPIPGELPWGAHAIGTAAWGGVRLADVLERAGVRDGARHVAFTGADAVPKDGEIVPFGGSVPIGKSADVLLVDEMNGEPLPAVHGGPLRALVPGVIGARSVKWLTRVEVRRDPSDSPFQARAYKLFAPDVGPDDVDWSRGETLGELPLNAVICSPVDGARVAAGTVDLDGYAVVGGGERVEAVEVSTDGGATWTPAELSEGGRWTWRLWTARIQLAPGRHELVVRARDSAGRTQAPDLREAWNVKGYVNAAWHRVSVEAR